MPIGVPLYEDRGWRYDLDELEASITPKTKILYLNSPHNPTGGSIDTATASPELTAYLHEKLDMDLVGTGDGRELYAVQGPKPANVTARKT